MVPLQRDLASCILLGKRLKFKFLYFFKQAICSLLFLVSIGTLAAKERLVRGFAKDAATSKPIPFPIISSEDGVYQAMGDMEGNFVIQIPFSVENLTIRAYSYLPETVVPDLADSARAYLHFAHPFSFQTITYGKSKDLMKQLKKVRYAIDPRMEKSFSYLSYNKVVITTESILSLKLHLDGLLRFFGSRPAHLSLDHHIFLMESATKRNFQNLYHQRETIVDSKVSGINKPPALSLVSGFEAMSVYESFLRIGTRKYISPLGGNFNKRYIFHITDSVKIDGQYVYIVKFNPRSLRNRDLLQGFLYISKNPLGVVGFQMWPAFDRESTYSLLQQSSLLPSGRWFPAQLKTVYNRSRLGSLNVPIQATSKTYIFNVSPLNQSDSSHYSEVIFDFKKDSLARKKEFPIELRQEALSQKDRNTYMYFKDVGSLDAIDQYLSLGQKLLAGRFPMGKVDLVFRKAVTVNEFEGLRLGLGLQTTEKLSKTHLGGGYFAYGIRDEKWKFGLNYQFNFLDRQSLLLNYQNDLAEPGIHSFAFNKLQYNTEPLRNLRIPRFDRVRLFEVAHVTHPLRNFYTRLGVTVGDRAYLYNYRFLPDAEHSSFQIVEMRGSIRWSPGEQFAQYEYERFSLGNPFPEFWLQVSQGIKGVVENSYNYTRLEAKMQWTRKILGLGELGVQLGVGKQWGLVPYPILFSARASFRDVSLVTFNSFETMRYNEFINDRFTNVFISHKFNKMQISSLPFRPFFTLMHNMGWGQISHPEVHEGIEVKGMPKGYYESGLFLNDIFVLPFFGLRMGVGAGAFVRYGNYALPSDFDNLVIKFAVNLGL